MRIKLNLDINGSSRSVPMNYQYPLSAWVYKVFNNADASFAKWLHEKGYVFNGKKKFKLFTFSNLHFSNFKMDKQKKCFHLLDSPVKMNLSFHMEQAAEQFVTGLFKDQKCEIADRMNKAEMKVSSVEREQEPEFGTEGTFRTLSPVCIAKPEERNGKLQAQYLSPEDNEYEKYFFDHLLRKYITAQPGKSESAGQLKEDASELKFELLGKPRSKLLTNKAGSPEETKIRGYLYDFRLKAPPELLRFGYEAGFGEKNSLGMGCVENRNHNLNLDQKNATHEK